MKMERDVKKEFYPELYLDIAKKYRHEHPSVHVSEFVDGTHAAIVFLLENTKDEEIISKIEELFTKGGATIEASWIYDEYDDKYRGKIELHTAKDEMCLEIIKMSHELEIYPLNEEEKRNAENYVRNTKDVFPKYVSEPIRGTHKAIIYILANSKNGDIKRTVLEIIEKYVKVEYVEVDMDHNAYYNKVSYKQLPNSIAKKLKVIAKEIHLEKQKQAEIFYFHQQGRPCYRHNFQTAVHRCRL